MENLEIMVNGYTVRGSNSAVFIFALSTGSALKEFPS